MAEASLICCSSGWCPRPPSLAMREILSPARVQGKRGGGSEMKEKAHGRGD